MEGNSKATATNFKLSLQLKHMLQKTPEGNGNRANLFLFTEKNYLKHVAPGLKDAVKTLLWNVYSVSQVVFCGICTWLIKTDCKSSPYLLHEHPEETEDIWLLKKRAPGSLQLWDKTLSGSEMDGISISQPSCHFQSSPQPVLQKKDVSSKDTFSQNWCILQLGIKEGNHPESCQATCWDLFTALNS